MAHPPSPEQRIDAPDLTALSRTTPGRGELRLRAVLRHSLPVAGVVVVVMLVAVIAYYVYDSNRRGAVALSNDLVTAIDRRVAVQTRAYLAPAEQFLELADAAAAGRGVFEGGPEVELFALHALGGIGPAAAFSYADPEGNFLYVLRNAQGGFDTKTIDRRNGGHRVTWVRRDSEGKVVATEEVPDDTFDPRARPWYQGAEETKKPFWTDTYLFFTLQKPGITFSIPHFDADGKLQSVLGVDIELATLCAFLKQLGIGVSGKALIIDRTGRVVAYPSDNWLPADKPDVQAPMLDELGDPVLIRAYNRLRIEGYGRKVLDFGDRRIIVSSEPVSMLTGRDWVVLIVVPETDFVGFVTDSGLAALIMSIIVVLIVAGLSGLLAWRNVAAERRISAAATLQSALETRTRTFVELARASGPADGAEAEGLESAAETAAAACAAKRVAVWRLSPDRTALLCEDCFDQVAHDHTTGMELHRDQLPDLFAALGNGAPIDVADASSDRRTSELFAKLSGAARDQQYLYRPDHLARPPAGHADGRGSAARRSRRQPGGILRRADGRAGAALCRRRRACAGGLAGSGHRDCRLRRSHPVRELRPAPVAAGADADAAEHVTRRPGRKRHRPGRDRHSQAARLDDGGAASARQ